MFIQRQSLKMSEGSPCSRHSTNQNLSDKDMLRYVQNHMTMAGTTDSIFCLFPLCFLIPCSPLGNRKGKHLNGSCNFTSHVFNVIVSKSTACCVPLAAQMIDYFKDHVLEKRKISSQSFNFSFPHITIKIFFLPLCCPQIWLLSVFWVLSKLLQSSTTPPIVSE